MIAFPQRRLSSFVLAVAFVSLSELIPCTQAQEPSAQAKPQETPAAQAPGTQPKKETPAQGTAAAAASAAPKFDPAVVSAGMAAFERDCTKCHDAARALERTKDLAGWRATVRRMAGKRGADVSPSDIEPIAVYLASRSTAPSGTATAGEQPAAPGAPAAAGAAAPSATAAAPSAETSSLSTFATLSPQWRGGNNHLQNPDFAPLAWIGASWQGKTVSVRATVCITCHGVQEPGQIDRIDPVEVAVRVDLSEYVESFCHGMKAAIDAGRFIVPFGAFSAQTDPSVYRTVSTPLIFNMGQRIFNQDLGFPVLPMPFADEGVNFSLGVPLGEWCTGPITASLDAYLDNGLEGSSNGIDFLQSRDLVDNNVRLASGARFTVGDPYIRVGSSVMSGRFDDPNASTLPRGLYYTIYGFDVQAHYKRLFRFQAEWARRLSERSGFGGNPAAVFSEVVAGYYLEAEARPYEKCRVSLLTRYDYMRRSSPLAFPGSTLPGAFDVERFTVGINIELWHQSLLMVDYERWLLPELTHPTADVFGIRYTITF
jgi:hypothetical protein